MSRSNILLQARRPQSDADWAVALGITGVVLLWWLRARAKLAAPDFVVDGIAVQRPKPEPGITMGAPAKLPDLPEPPKFPDKPACDPDIGPVRFSTAKAKGALKNELNRLVAGSEPYAVRLTYPSPGSPQYLIEGFEGGVRAAKEIQPITDPDTGQQWAPAIPFRPPGPNPPDVTSPKKGRPMIGYVLNRSRTTYGPLEAAVVVNDAADLNEKHKVPVATTRLVKAGRVTRSWTVALWVPSLCAYRLYTVRGSPGHDALYNRF